MSQSGKKKAAAVLLAGMLAWSGSAAITVMPAELAQKAQWVRQNLLTAGALPPFSFTYDGRPSSALLPAWTRSATDTVLDANRTRHVITWTDHGLQVSCVAVEYNDFPMVEWTVYLENTGLTNTPLLQGIQGLDTTITRANGPEFILNGIQGDYCSATSYQPYQTTLNPATVNSFSPPGNSGKSCDGPVGWPYYNLQQPGGGVILAVGWPGQWASSFTRDSGSDLRIQAGQQLTHLSLNPGEKIRTPLIALMFWQGTNLVRSQNLWRHWYLAHEIPQVNGRPPATFIGVAGDNTNMVNAYAQAGIKFDVLWRDADTEPYTWYPVTPYPNTVANWIRTGTWEVDTNSYPHGFGPVSTAVHALGLKFLLWFEPERVGNPSSWLAAKHPDWLLPGTSSTVGDILNEGNPVAFNWLTNHIQSMIVSNGLDWYREDMNGCGPLPVWRNNDAPDRQGMTENFYVQGHLAYWDALLAMNPGLQIDCCGSGGRRNDLEAMRRSVPLWRSDYVQQVDRTTLGDVNQNFSYALFSWLPFQGTGCNGCWDPYSFRSSYLAAFDTGGLTPANAAAQRQAFSECHEIAPYILTGDYYPLTPYSATNNVWMAWQFDRPGRNDGLVQVFRRGNCPEQKQSFRLCGLDPLAIYKITNLDEKGFTEVSGKELMGTGLPVEIKDKPGAAVILYKNEH